MVHFASHHKRNLFCFLILFIALPSFTADIFDLRDELQILSCPNNSLDNNITTGMTDHFVFDPAPILTHSPVQWATSVVVSSTRLPSCGLRAPPFQS